MKIRTDKALISDLIMKSFEFDIIKGRVHNPGNIDFIMNCLLSCKIDVMEYKKYYRARRIYADSQEIEFLNGIPQNGFCSDKSGVAPIHLCMPGRANDSKEQVLYISEDEKTAIKEVRTPKFDFASVASCLVDKEIRVFDFSPFTEKELETYVSTSKLGDREEIISKTLLFIKMQRILTLEEYAENNYIISRELVKIIKQGFPDVSGIKYISHFTGKNNYALWDDNKYLEFSDGVAVMCKY